MSYRKFVDIGVNGLREILDYDATSGDFTWKSRLDVPGWWNLKYSGKPAGCIRRDGYRVIRINNVGYFAHRLAWLMVYNEWPDIIDHIDQDKSNNQIANLRACKHQDNLCNRSLPKNNTSGYKGVSYHKASKKWAAKIKSYGEWHHLGIFHSPQEAHSAYAIAAKRLHGEFARWT